MFIAPPLLYYYNMHPRHIGSMTPTLLYYKNMYTSCLLASGPFLGRATPCILVALLHPAPF